MQRYFRNNCTFHACVTHDVYVIFYILFIYISSILYILGNCSRKCLITGIWERPDMSKCVSQKLDSLNKQVWPLFHKLDSVRRDGLRC